MADITLTIPNASLSRVVDGFAFVHGYQAQVPDASKPGTFTLNSESKAQFLKRKLVEYVKSAVISAEANAASEAARKPAEDTAKAIAIT